MASAKTTAKWFFSSLVLHSLSEQMRTAAKRLVKAGQPREQGVIVARATEVLDLVGLPVWSGRHDTKFFLLIDVPEQAIILLPSKLNLRRAEQRLYATRDAVSLRRLIVAQFRDRPMDGIVDGFLLPDQLVVFSGDLELRRFPLKKLPPLKELDPEALSNFTIDRDGSFLHWGSGDLHLGVSELMMATDRNYLIEREIERAQEDHIAKVLLHMRSTKGLRQSDIPGLSERHVRRLEKGEADLTAAAADKLARAFGLSTAVFLEQLSELSSLVARSSYGKDPSRSNRKKEDVA